MSRGLVKREIEQVKNLLNSKYSNILVLLANRKEEQKKKEIKDFTISELNNELDGNYRITWRYVQTMEKVNILKTYPDVRGRCVRLVDNQEAKNITEKIMGTNFKGIIKKGKDTVGKKKFRDRCIKEFDRLLD